MPGLTPYQTKIAEDMYLIEKKSMRQIAKHFKISGHTVKYYLKKSGVVSTFKPQLRPLSTFSNQRNFSYSEFELIIGNRVVDTFRGKGKTHHHDFATLSKIHERYKEEIAMSNRDYQIYKRVMSKFPPECQ